MKKVYVTPEQHTVVLHYRQQLLTASAFEFTDGYYDDGFVNPNTEVNVGEAL